MFIVIVEKEIPYETSKNMIVGTYSNEKSANHIKMVLEKLQNNSDIIQSDYFSVKIETEKLVNFKI